MIDDRACDRDETLYGEHNNIVVPSILFYAKNQYTSTKFLLADHPSHTRRRRNAVLRQFVASVTANTRYRTPITGNS